MSALGFVGGLAGAVAFGIYGLIAFVFLTAAMLELAEHRRTSRLSFSLAFAAALLWPVSLVVASVAAIHAGQRHTRKPSTGCAEPERPSTDRACVGRPNMDRPMLALVERGTASLRAHGEGLLARQVSGHPVKPAAEPDLAAAPALGTPAASSPSTCGPSLEMADRSRPIVRSLAPLQMQPQPPFGIPGPDSRSRIILSPRQALGAARQGKSKPAANRHRLRQTALSKPKKGEPD